MSQVVGEADWW